MDQEDARTLCVRTVITTIEEKISSPAEEMMAFQAEGPGRAETRYY